MSDAYSADVWICTMQWQAMRMLADHELLDAAYWNAGRSAAWLIGKPGTNIHRVEIIAGAMGSLVVHGDFDLARFAYYGDHADAWSRLRWMADCTDVGYYVAQKAAIGMRRQDAEEYDERVARHDLQALIRDAESLGYDPRLVVLLEQALDHTEDEPGLWQFLSDGDQGWDLWEHRFGKVLAPHVIISHVALNKCASLLRERHGDRGPRECWRNTGINAQESLSP